jgi:hypothetical protein
MRSRTAAVLLLAAATLAGCGSSASSSTSSSQTSPAATQPAQTTTTQQPALGFEGVPLQQGPELAPASTTGTATVDGIQCAPAEQLVYHIHAHLSVYDHGQPRALPAGIGIPGSVTQQTQYGPIAAGGQCIYWLHTHTTDGIIHVESPTARVYTLGNFFDIWRQPLSPTQVAGASGTVTAVVNGKSWTHSPRAIPLLPHAVIQLSVGTPVVPFKGLSWSGLQL